MEVLFVDVPSNEIYQDGNLLNLTDHDRVSYFDISVRTRKHYRHLPLSRKYFTIRHFTHGNEIRLLSLTRTSTQILRLNVLSNFYV